jgi:hypothetical protein
MVVAPRMLAATPTTVFDAKQGGVNGASSAVGVLAPRPAAMRLAEWRAALRGLCTAVVLATFTTAMRHAKAALFGRLCAPVGVSASLPTAVLPAKNVRSHQLLAPRVPAGVVIAALSSLGRHVDRNHTRTLFYTYMSTQSAMSTLSPNKVTIASTCKANQASEG